LLLISGFPHKNEKNTIIIRVRRGCWNIEKRLKLVEKVQKCERLKFDSIFLTDGSLVDKEN